MKNTFENYKDYEILPHLIIERIDNTKLYCFRKKSDPTVSILFLENEKEPFDWTKHLGEQMDLGLIKKK